MITQEMLDRAVYLDRIADQAKALDDEALMAYIGEKDPNAEHDDLHEPDGELAVYWREAGNRGLLEIYPGPSVTSA